MTIQKHKSAELEAVMLCYVFYTCGARRNCIKTQDSPSANEHAAAIEVDETDLSLAQKPKVFTGRFVQAEAVRCAFHTRRPG